MAATLPVSKKDLADVVHHKIQGALIAVICALGDNINPCLALNELKGHPVTHSRLNALLYINNTL